MTAARPATYDAAVAWLTANRDVGPNLRDDDLVDAAYAALGFFDRGAYPDPDAADAARAVWGEQFHTLVDALHADYPHSQ
jgi:hypothetical protein